MVKVWADKAWEDYLYWQEQDKKTLRCINQLLKDIDRNAFDGIGKPQRPTAKSLQQQRLTLLENADHQATLRSRCPRIV